MRKVTVRLKPNFILMKKINKICEKVEKIELEEIIKIDYEKGLKVAIVNLYFKKKFTINDVLFPTNTKIEILATKENVSTVLIKATIPKAMKSIFRQFDLDLIWDKPSGLFNGEILYSCIGEEKVLQKFVRMTKLIGKIENISYNIANYRGYNILEILTKKQKEIYEFAKEEGYYEYPRKINGKELAKKLNISKPTLIEHLRKIENKIFSNIE